MAEFKTIAQGCNAFVEREKTLPDTLTPEQAAKLVREMHTDLAQLFEMMHTWMRLRD